MSYTPPYEITNKILSLVAEISEKIGKMPKTPLLNGKKLSLVKKLTKSKKNT